MNGKMVCVLVAILYHGTLVTTAETPDETLARLRASGGSTCISGTSTALTVGGMQWKSGNEGLAVLASPLPKPISILNVKPIDGLPLDEAGLKHLAAAEPSRVIRFHRDSIDDAGMRHFVDALHAQQNPHLRIELRYVDITDASVIHLMRLDVVDVIKLHHTGVSPDASVRLSKALPNGNVEYTPRKGFEAASPIDGEP